MIHVDFALPERMMHAGRRMQGGTPCFKVHNKVFLVDLYDMVRPGRQVWRTPKHAELFVDSTVTFFFFFFFILFNSILFFSLLHSIKPSKQSRQVLANLGTKRLFSECGNADSHGVQSDPLLAGENERMNGRAFVHSGHCLKLLI